MCKHTSLTSSCVGDPATNLCIAEEMLLFLHLSHVAVCNPLHSAISVAELTTYSLVYVFGLCTEKQNTGF